MLTTKEILKKVRLLEIKSKKLTTDLFTGEYHSAFKGKGMSFKEVREYAAGDDIRFIDWNVSARFGHPFSKVFEEERELTVMLLIDVSASSLFGTINGTKKDIATEIAAVIAFSAVNNGDKVGVILYSDKIEKTLPKLGMLRIEDSETGQQKWIDTNSSFVRYEYEKEFFRVTDYCIDTFKRAACSLLHVRTDEDYVKVLQRFFISRNK